MKPSYNQIVSVQKTLARKDNRVLVLTHQGELLMLRFNNPLPEEFDIDTLRCVPINHTNNIWDETQQRIVVPVYDAEIPLIQFLPSALQA